MAANDADFSGALSGKSQSDEDRRRYGPESSKASRNSKHNSRSRSRSVERKRKSGDKRHRRSRSRSKEVRRKDSLKCRSGSEEPELSDKGRDRLSEDMEERQRRKERKSSRTRSTSRSRSRERRHHNRNWDKRRSRSRSGDRRSKSHEKKRRGRSQSNSKGKHRHRSRSHSKSREKKKRTEKTKRRSRSRSATPVAFRGRNTAMDAQEALARRLDRAKKLQEQKEKELLDKQQQDRAAAAAPLSCDTVTAAAGPALNVAALLASGTQVTPQIAMAAQMAALQAKTLAETGIAVPSYYNPSAVNPMKFAEQEKKRKRLWQGKKEGDKSQTAELWEKLSFGNKDQNVKFRKLMGIKGEEESGPSGAVNEEGMKTLQQQEEMFRNLDVQYEMARSQTHTQRGMGLGFSSSFSSRGMDAV
ncbi:arginine/serine-rich coiled-coil protein 2 isoform X1 [Triplophysa rosa]|uniref:Arginine/serine-rich coiled-coil protein 2 n=1 Tax=Triplophysa rosa TaxID=992332 RepID=A0A9W7X3A3_TRIRA|nr:arginine/serine-rich coiled-coil protein 2 isoform X1 [Triplophysa rosa]KAI7812964.1 arginine/serine-rich coiled-coil protein 2 [Triplophysa rosa]